MKTPELETISIFSKDLTLNLTINQISKILNKSYAFTNKYVRNFLDEGILSKKIVGSAILCSLNYSNEKTLGFLMLNSITDKMVYLSKADPKIIQLSNEIKSINSVKSIFMADKKLHIVCENKEEVQQKVQQVLKQQKIKSLIINFIEPDEFKLNVKGINLTNTIIMEGYESFWKSISQMML